MLEYLFKSRFSLFEGLAVAIISQMISRSWWFMLLIIPVLMVSGYFEKRI